MESGAGAEEVGEGGGAEGGGRRWSRWRGGGRKRRVVELRLD